MYASQQGQIHSLPEMAKFTEFYFPNIFDVSIRTGNIRDQSCLKSRRILHVFALICPPNISPGPSPDGVWGRGVSTLIRNKLATAIDSCTNAWLDDPCWLGNIYEMFIFNGKTIICKHVNMTTSPFSSNKNLTFTSME